MEKVKYNTKQKQQILDLFKNNIGNLFSVKEISLKLELNGKATGVSTIYRFLDELAIEGHVKKYKEKNMTKYGYFSCVKQNHYHLKCDNCNEVIHIDCKSITNMRDHILGDHGFEIDIENLFITGRCKECR
jgi:Fe2+/Zn2+ uptake regulation proteins